MKPKKGAAAAATVALLWLSACQSGVDKGPPQEAPTPVRVARVEVRQFSEEIVALGTLRARESVEITANVTEKVARVRFADGQAVQPDQVLVELVRAEELSRIEQAQAQLAREQAELTRVERLAKDAIATASELDGQRTRVETARANLKTTEAQLGDRLVRAPFAGVVGLRRVSPGSLVTPATVITTLDAIDRLYADLPLPERYTGQIAKGQTVRLKSDAFADSIYVGVVVAVDGRVDISTRALTVRAEVENPQRKLRPGMLMRALLNVGNRTSPAVSEHALVQRASRAYVYTVDEKRLTKLVEVEVGGRQPGWVEIRAGLKVGEEVVTDGTNRVKPGMTVLVRE